MNDHYVNKIQEIKRNIPNSIYNPITLLDNWMTKEKIQPKQFKLKRSEYTRPEKNHKEVERWANTKT